MRDMEKDNARDHMQKNVGVEISCQPSLQHQSYSNFWAAERVTISACSTNRTTHQRSPQFGR